MIIRELPEAERPREKMCVYGCSALSNAELIAIIIGSGTKDKSAIEVAQRILSLDEEGLGFIGRCTVEEASEVEGIGTAKACRLIAAAELGRRIASGGMNKKAVIESYEDAAVFLMENMRYYREEHFTAMLLNSHGSVISLEEIAIGDIMSMVIHPREVFSMAVRRKAAAVILAHNHPSGDCTPSSEDIQTTHRLIRAGEIMGIKVLDHIIIGDGTFISMKNKKLI